MRIIDALGVALLLSEKSDVWICASHAIAFVLCFSIALNELKAKEDLKELSARVLKSVGTVLAINKDNAVLQGALLFVIGRG